MTAPHLTASDRRLAARASRPKHAVRWAIRPRAVLWDRNCRTRVGPAQRANNRRLAADYPVISRRSPGSRPARHQAHRRPTARDPAASVGIRYPVRLEFPILSLNPGSRQRCVAPGVWPTTTEVRSHASLKGHTPLTFVGGHMVARAELNNVR